MPKIFTSFQEWPLIQQLLKHGLRYPEVRRNYCRIFNDILTAAGMSVIAKHAAQFKEYIVKDYEVRLS